ncbi:MAG TPA: thioredoxin domain-containing protein [Bryobacteraceae bacterium]|nr:thioredoxin domain-containing protein [Bryobacteraceae bacterium]
MSKCCLRAIVVAGLCLLGAALVSAQDWNTMESLPGIDLSSLSPAQKATALKLIRARDCSCGCGMKVAECRVKDPNCYYSKGLAGVIIASLKAGKSEKDALADAEASRFAHAPEHKLLEDPIEIPTAGAPMTGPANAPITLVEFSDFQCPYCTLATPQLQAVLKAYPTQVKLIFKEFPLDMHSQAAFAAAAAVAAQKQGKFWPMHDALFASHADLRRPTVLALASAIGLDVKRFESDVDSAEVRKAVARDLEDGSNVGVMSTPTLFIDGQHYNGNIRLDVLKPILDAELKHPATPGKKVSAAATASR